MRMSEPPPVIAHCAACGACEPPWLSSAFMNRILSLVALSISTVFATAGAYTQSSAYMKSRPLALMAAAVFSISSMTRSYMSALRTCLPIGTWSPPRPK
jgi:hypothetical protein